MKKLFILLFIVFLNQCGYEKIYSGENLDITIKNIKKENNIINNELSNTLLSILSNKRSNNIFDLEIQSKKVTEVKSKDTKGNPSVYVLKLETKIIAKDKMKKEYTNIFYKQMSYNNDDDKFKLSQYTSEIEKILIKETVAEIIDYLTDVK